MITNFRVWDEGSKSMYKVNHIDFRTCMAYCKDDNGSGRNFNYMEYPIMQSTRLFNTEGKEIFEGDVVKMDYFNCKNGKPVKKSHIGIVKQINFCWVIDVGDNLIYLDHPIDDFVILGHKYMDEFKDNEEAFK